MERLLRIETGQVVLIGGAAPVSAPVTALDFAFDECRWQLDYEIKRRTSATQLHRKQIEVGKALSRIFLPSAVAEALRGLLERVEQEPMSLRLGIDVVDEALRDLPWETLCLDDKCLALEGSVQLYRCYENLKLPARSLALQNGPLRILVAIGSPERQNARGELLDMEAELARILSAVDPARQSGRASIDFLEFGSLHAIKAAFEARKYHALYLSCHAGPGQLVLEGVDGEQDLVDASKLRQEALPSEGLPLVILAGCSTALGVRDEKADKRLPGLAYDLLASGIPRVLAMRASVSDPYAIEFGAEFFGELADHAEPLRALTAARRRVEERRIGGHGSCAEWSTPVLILDRAVDPSARLFDRVEANEPNVAQAAPPLLAASLVTRRVGELVGRRSDQRRLLRHLRSDSRPAAVSIRGMGGLGKSTLATKLVARLAEDGFQIVSFFGEVDPHIILNGVSGIVSASKRTGDNQAKRADPSDLDAFAGFRALRSRLLAITKVLLFFDNFEDNLGDISDGARFRNPRLAEFLATWAEDPGLSRLLFTSRHPIPIATDLVQEHVLGPMSFAETRKLIWRLPALNRCNASEQERIWQAVGGHPRTLEYLDALLCADETPFAEAENRREKSLSELGCQPSSPSSLDVALAKVAKLAAQDVFLDALRERLTVVSSAERLFLGAAVYRQPVPEQALLWQLSAHLPNLPEGAAAWPEIPRHPDFLKARDALLQLGLLAPVDDGDPEARWLVHRWTATALIEREKQEQVLEAHRRAAGYWRWRYASATQFYERAIRFLLEARYHHFQAGELELAIQVSMWAGSQLHTWGAYRREEDLIQDLMRWLPAEDPRREPHLHQLGLVAQRKGELDRATEWYRQELSLSQRSGNLQSKAAALFQLSAVALERGETQEALSSLEEAEQVYASLADRARLTSIQFQLGRIHEEQGDLERAFDKYQLSLAVRRELDDPEGVGKCLHQLGLIAQRRGDLDEAEKCFDDALILKKERGDQSGISRSYHQLGRVAQERGDLATALDWFRKSLAIRDELGDRKGKAICLHQMGVVAQRRSEPELARSYFREALELAEALGDREGVAATVSQIGILLTETGEASEAVGWNLRSLGIRQELHRPEIRTDYHWLRCQHEILGHEEFCRAAGRHLAPEGLSQLLVVLGIPEP